MHSNRWYGLWMLVSCILMFNVNAHGQYGGGLKQGEVQYCFTTSVEIPSKYHEMTICCSACERPVTYDFWHLRCYSCEKAWNTSLIGKKVCDDVIPARLGLKLMEPEQWVYVGPNGQMAKAPALPPPYAVFIVESKHFYISCNVPITQLITGRTPRWRYYQCNGPFEEPETAICKNCYPGSEHHVDSSTGVVFHTSKSRVSTHENDQATAADDGYHIAMVDPAGESGKPWWRSLLKAQKQCQADIDGCDIADVVKREASTSNTVETNRCKTERPPEIPNSILQVSDKASMSIATDTTIPPDDVRVQVSADLVDVRLGSNHALSRNLPTTYTGKTGPATLMVAIDRTIPPNDVQIQTSASLVCIRLGSNHALAKTLGSTDTNSLSIVCLISYQR